MPKNDKKLKLCWTFEKIYLLEKFYGKTCLSSKSPSGSVESRSDNPPDNFLPKLRFFHKFLKKSSPPPPRPLSEKKYQSEHFSRKIFFLEKLIWPDKDAILTICFQSSKNICRVSRRSEKVLKTLIQPKKDRLPKEKHPDFRIQFWQSCWGFSKMVRNFAPICYEKKCSISEKSYPFAYNFPGKKISMKKLLETDKTHFWQSVEVLLSKYDKILVKFWKKLVNKFLF